MRIHILAFFLVFQSFFACQQGSEKSRLSGADTVLQSSVAYQQSPEKARPPAANIIFQSADGGQTWQDVSAGLPQDLQVGRIFADGDQVFLASESGLYHSSTSQEAPVWEKAFLLNVGITDVFPGRAGLYASSYRNGFFQEIPGTDIWAARHHSLKDKTVRAILETPDGAIFVGCESGIFKSADGGNTWKHVFAEGMVNSFAAAGDVLVCGGFRGMLRSTDGGEHWSWVLTGDGGAYNTKLIKGRFVTLTDGGGSWKPSIGDGIENRLYTSGDSGKTWQRMDEGLSHIRLIHKTGERLPQAQVINDIEQAGKYLFCSLDAGIFRSSDWGINWELVRPSNGKNLINLAVSGQVVYAVIVVGC